MQYNLIGSSYSYKKTIIFFSIGFSILVASGFYGFGYDWYEAYNRPNLQWGLWHRDRLGFAVSTLTIYNIHFGIYITSLLLALSTGILVETFFKISNIQSLFFFIIIFIGIIHTWPVIMSTSNAMRQGLSMSFIFLMFSAIVRNNKKLSFIYIIISTFLHTAGPLYLFIYGTMLILLKFNTIIKKKNHLLFVYLFISIIVCLGIILSLMIFSPLKSETLVIGKDFSKIFVFIGFIYIFLFINYFSKTIKNPINIFLFIFSFISLTLFFYGFNWEYERLNMMMTIPYIMVIGSFIKGKDFKLIFLILTFGLLLLLTFYTGMYASLE